MNNVSNTTSNIQENNDTSIKTTCSLNSTPECRLGLAARRAAQLPKLRDINRRQRPDSVEDTNMMFIYFYCLALLMLSVNIDLSIMEHRNVGCKEINSKETTHTCTQGMDSPYPKKVWQKFTIGQKFGICTL
uniref:Uncharacterized protein n=1 Tax=Romanomermis culicivorax TaxID=13658 RepID=A0A915HM90_ROMCU